MFKFFIELLIKIKIKIIGGVFEATYFSELKKLENFAKTWKTKIILYILENQDTVSESFHKT